jgi:pimeloyl-ACP methyl ester carboxylesterase
MPGIARTVIFGGDSTCGERRNDTWLYDGVTWTNANPPVKPSGRTNIERSMAYHAGLGRLLLFGGLGGSGFETWLFDGSNWTQLITAGTPASRDQAMLAYDKSRQVMVLFGGSNPDSLTWELASSNWVSRATANAPTRNRFQGGLAYSDAIQKVVSFGGSSSDGVDRSNETWVYDGTNWTQAHPVNSPPARAGHAMDYDAGLGKVVIHGGYNASRTPLTDTWVYDGITWQQVDSIPLSPAPNGLAMAYDSARGKHVTFSGIRFPCSPSATGTWELTLAAPQPSCFSLSAAVNPPSGGTVATNVPRNCNSGTGYTSGVSLTMTATPSSGNRFLGWSGAATGTSKVINLVMDGNKSLTANFGPVQSLQLPPIIFVHGWHGRDLFAETSCSTGVQHFPDQTSRSDFGPIPSWLYQDFDVWIAHLTTSAFNTISLDDNGDCLRKQIDFVFTSTQNSQVTLIAHSMGGLVSRAAIEKTPINDRVRTLITLGSPHLGVPAANVGAFGLCLLRDVGACEFSELGMALIFNPRYSTRNVNTDYVVVGGLARDLIPRLASFNGDGIIPQRSAINLLGAGVTAIGTHESHTDIFGFPTYMQAAPDALSLPNAGVSFRCVISPTVYGRPRPQDCTAGQSPQRAAEEVPPLSQTPLISGSVAAGQVVSHALWVESSGSSVFNLSWITGTLDFTLTSPVGQVITPGYAQANPSVAQFSSIPISSPFGAMASYGFTTTTPGLWTLWVGNSGPVSPVGYRLQVDFESPLAMTTSLNNNVYPVGSTIVLTTAIGVGPAISNVQARVLFLWPDGATSAVTATAVDSNTLVAQTVVPPTSAGYAMAQVSVSGYVNGAPFEQGSHAEFLVPASGAKLAGAYADHAVDESATGLFNALNWEAGISVTAPATYTLSADLIGAGQVIAHAQSQGYLASGTPTVTVKFSGDAIRASQMDGPYTVTNVVLIDSSSFGLLADSANAVWTTGSYSWKGFAATCYVLTLGPNAGGAVSANPAPDCNSGLQYAAGTVVTVTATANSGYLFSHWSDDASGSSNVVTVTLSADRVPTANFTRWPHEAFLPILLR